MLGFRGPFFLRGTNQGGFAFPPFQTLMVEHVGVSLRFLQKQKCPDLGLQFQGLPWPSSALLLFFVVVAGVLPLFLLLVVVVVVLVVVWCWCGCCASVLFLLVYDSRA